MTMDSKNLQHRPRWIIYFEVASYNHRWLSGGSPILHSKHRRIFTIVPDTGACITPREVVSTSTYQLVDEFSTHCWIQHLGRTWSPLPVSESRPPNKESTSDCSHYCRGGYLDKIVLKQFSASETTHTVGLHPHSHYQPQYIYPSSIQNESLAWGGNKVTSWILLAGQEGNHW